MGDNLGGDELGALVGDLAQWAWGAGCGAEERGAAEVGDVPGEEVGLILQGFERGGEVFDLSPAAADFGDESLEFGGVWFGGLGGLIHGFMDLWFWFGLNSGGAK